MQKSTLEEVHHQQLWRLWLISAIVSRENDHFWHDWEPNKNFVRLPTTSYTCSYDTVADNSLSDTLQI